ncbi:hypothetical protein AVEN_148904-1 [Araneus ventricosus]|uniref:Uncharacterized protein n=1 Tax=Araneus ventricosus TaxID=182803 RepID=A0A4Y2DIE6_ARAVE|nr:hypothetical protein AVEN_148904-1 [Araneus ventricosus]
MTLYFNHNLCLCEDSRTAAEIGLTKVATWTVGKLHKGPRLSLDINQSPGGRKTSLVDITELSANPHELGGPCSWENEDLSCGGEEKKKVDFDRRSSLDRIPIIASLFECWIFGSVLEVTGSHVASCEAERSRVKKLYASV